MASAFVTLLKREGLYLIILPVLFLILSAFSLLFISSERRTSRLLAEYQVDRTAAALLENELARSVTGQPSTIGVPESLIGFGLYAPDGASITASPGAPARLEPSGLPERESFTFHASSSSIALVRRLGAFGGPAGPGRMTRLHLAPEGDQPGPRFGMLGMMRAAPPIGPAFLYLDLSVPSYFARARVLGAAWVGAPLFIAALLLSIGALARRNRHYRERLESQRTLVQLGETARTLSHEIKNPLSSIKLQTALLRKIWRREGGAGAMPGAGAARGAGEGSGAQAAGAGGWAPHETAAPRGAAAVQHTAAPRELDLIEEEVDRLVRLTERMSEFVRDPAGTPESIEVGSFVRDLLGRFSWPVAPPAEEGDPCFVRFDPDRLRSVLENLVRNAVESVGDERPGRQPEPVASVTIRATKSRVDISVLDRGAGLDPAAMEHLFDPFFTTKTRGSGIGLAISKRFVEAAGGTLSLAPAKPAGAEALVSLPRAQA